MLVFCGEVLKVRGIKGEVFVKPSPDFEDLLFISGEKVTLKSQKYLSTLCVEYCREIEGNVVLKFQNVDSISEAYRLIGYAIYREGEPDREQSRSLLDFTVEDINGHQWGTVTQFSLESRNPLLEIDSEGDTIYIPFTDTIIVKIDKRRRIIVIDPPEGLMDLNK